jgi:amino acid transporter
MIPTQSAVIPDKSTSASRSLSLLSLTALVVGSMIGCGVLGLPQNMAAGPMHMPALDSVILWVSTVSGVIDSALGSATCPMRYLLSD